MTARTRSAFTLFQLLVVLAILLILFALFLPAIIKAQANAQRMKATNNLRQLVLALHNYAATYNNRLPLGIDENHFSTASRLLPYIEQQNVYNRIDFKKSIDDKANAPARKVKIKTFLSTADPIESVKDDWGATNYLFNDKLFSSKPTYNISNIPDGTSNTIAVGETLKGDGKTKATDVQRQYVLLKKDALKDIKPDTGVKDFQDNKNIAGDRCASWMDGRFLQGTFNGMLQPNDKRPDVNCAGAGGVSALRSFDEFVLVALADGSARAVKNSISRPTWQNALDPADGNVLGPDW